MITSETSDLRQAAEALLERCNDLHPLWAKEERNALASALGPDPGEEQTSERPQQFASDGRSDTTAEGGAGAEERSPTEQRAAEHVPSGNIGPLGPLVWVPKETVTRAVFDVLKADHLSLYRQFETLAAEVAKLKERLP